MKPDTRSFYAEMVQRTIGFIAAHLDESLDLTHISRAAAMSPYHFHRVFKGMVGETPLELTRRLRLERAAWQLATTERPVTEIAFDAGYEAHEAFTRAFRLHFATSPSGFRDRRHPRIELATPSGVHYRADGHVPSFMARESGGAHMDVVIRQMPAVRLATVRHIGPYNQIPIAFERLGRSLGPSAPGLFAGGAAMVALYHDDPESVPLDQLRSDAGVTLPDGAACPPGLVEQVLAGGRYACTLHVGPYEQLGDSWTRFLGEWLPASGHRLAEGPSYERYLNDPSQTPQADLRTELYAPLA